MTGSSLPRPIPLPQLCLLRGFVPLLFSVGLPLPLSHPFRWDQALSLGGQPLCPALLAQGPTPNSKLQSPFRIESPCAGDAQAPAYSVAWTCSPVP